MYIRENPNPKGIAAGDCVVRAIAIAEDESWHSVYDGLHETGRELGDMPSSNRVWGEYLKEHGWTAYDGGSECMVIHEYTTADLKEAIKTIRREEVK